MHTHIDYKYTLDLFNRIDQMKIGGKSLKHVFVVDDYNYWQCYRQRLFEDIKQFSATRTWLPKEKQPISHFLKDSFVNGILLSVGCVAVCLSVIQRKKVAVYAIDTVSSVWKSDFRLATLYAFLSHNRIAYTELFHTVSGRRPLYNLMKRRRMALYLETSDWLCRVATFFTPHRGVGHASVTEEDLENFSAHEREFVKYSIERYIRQISVSRLKVFLLERIFRLTGIKVLFTIDDPRYYNEILIAAKRVGVRSYAIQHGHITKYHVGWLKGSDTSGECIYPDHFLVWSTYWKNELIRLGSLIPENVILIAGEREEVGQHTSQEVQNTSSITVLIPYETACPKREVANYIHRLLACPHVRIIFKIRPDMEAKDQLTEYGLQDLVHPHFSTRAHITNDISAIDIVAGVYSTLLYDMIAYEKRVVILETTSDYGEGMYLNKLADFCRMSDDICAFFQKVKDMPESEVQRRKDVLVEKHILLRDTLSRIAYKNHLLT